MAPNGATISDEIDAEDAELMARYGIKMVPTPRFHYKSFRFSRLADALRQARLDDKSA
ncbi:hypothetical protein [Sphingobium nicotianae]|nr:hypothetical protein [Sphingobium nicotianae]